MGPSRSLILVGIIVISPVFSMQIDSNMHPTYQNLATHLLDVMRQKTEPHWVCIAGGPGSGKSTLAAAVADMVNEQAGEEVCVVLPMDGFHFSRAKLKELDPPEASELLPRRGAPWTFDAQGCYACYAAAKRDRQAVLPTYSRELSDPVPGGVRLEKHHRLVLVEGNYLLMAGPELDHGRWMLLDELWDERWFIRCADAAEQRRRLIARHLETWNDEKAKRWGEGEAGAAARADANDVLNMDLIAPCEKFAERVILSL